MEHPLFFWILFHAVILILLALDLKGFRRKSEPIRQKKALLLTLFWVAAALLFNLFVYTQLGKQAALQFFTGYLIEKSLSVDNLFVFLIVFSYFKISPILQHKVLYWGILGAIIFRIALILLGVQFIERFHWATAVLGLLLLATGVKFALQKEQQIDPDQNFLVRIVKKFFPVSPKKECDAFFVKEKGRWMITTLFIVHLTIESADLVFALDSIPAIFAVTTDPFIVYTSNIFAILGLRSLYFVLASYFNKLRFFKYGLAVILIFIGVKLLIAKFHEISLLVSLSVVLGVLFATTLVSVYTSRRRI